MHPGTPWRRKQRIRAPVAANTCPRAVACNTRTAPDTVLRPLHPLRPRPCLAGDYDTYVRTRAELEENQMKKYKWEQEQVGACCCCLVLLVVVAV